MTDVVEPLPPFTDFELTAEAGMTIIDIQMTKAVSKQIIFFNFIGCFLLSLMICAGNHMLANATIPNRDIIIIPLWDNFVKDYSFYLAGGNHMFRLKEIRQKRGISQVKLAMDLNMGQNTVSRYENEQRQADYKTLILFADYFHVSLDYLLGRTDDPNGYQ